MFLLGMYAAVAQQAHQVKAGLAALLHRRGQDGVSKELTGPDHQLDARDVHVDDAPAANIQMADFAIAHLSFGQSDKRTGSVNQSVREFAVQLIPGWLFCQSDGIALLRSAE